jgi:surface-anchored protein
MSSMPRRPQPGARRLLATVVLTTLTALGITTVPEAPVAAQAPDPALEQTLTSDEPVATQPAEVATGHVDIGPRYVDGTWRLMIHDDSTVQPVWRSPTQTVLRVSDASLQEVPADPDYDFLPASSGARVHVVPQVQDPDVIWVGWNTQSPEVIERIDRGATLTLRGVEGPGELTMFLQAGMGGAPEVLWQSTDPVGQPFWVDVNTHTHANWVFSAPGVYVVDVEVTAVLLDGRTETDVATLRFAVGDDASTADALAAPGPERWVKAAAESPGAEDPDTTSGPGASGGPALWLLLVAVAAALVAAVVVVSARGARQRRAGHAEAAAERSATPPTAPEP